ncbi:hypothetical protein [Pelosinus sp. sgz500959]|uniref:hypothetical protein n=1 Tax=Pelosinus sp. sgz500959 TaxID=3242472 RepID=UPI00366AC2DB
MKLSKEITWVNVSEVKEVKRTQNTNIYITAACMEDSDEVHICLREFARFRTREEKTLGMQIEECPYRQTHNGVTFRQERLGELITKLQELYDDLFTRVYYEEYELNGTANAK